MAPKTSEPLQLRPMSVGDLLDTAFRLYRRHFLLFIGIIAVIQVPLTFLDLTLDTALNPAQSFGDFSDESEALEQFYQETPEDLSFRFGAWVLGQLGLFAVTFFAVQGLMSAAMTQAVYDRYLGQPQGLVDTYRALGWRWLRLAGALLALGLLDVGIALLLIIPCLGWIAAPILLIFINVPILSLLAPVIVVEEAGTLAGLRRAFRLGRRKFWRVLGINFLLWLLTAVISVPLSLLFGVAFALWEPSYSLQAVVLSLLQMVTMLLVRPVVVCGLTLLYFDLRIRLEGFDLELAARQMVAEGETGA